MKRMTMGNRAALGSSVVAALGLLIALLLVLAPPARATEKHTFDPLLSLRGNCNTNVLDQTPDPGLCPGVPGVDHPPKAFAEPCGSAVDRHGDIYVASAAGATSNTTGGRIDVFSPQGEYLTEFKDEHQPCSIAVDSEGNVYAAEYAGKNVVLFKPKAFPPAKGTEYEGPLIVIKNSDQDCRSETWSLAVDPSNDHLYTAPDCDVFFERDSAANGNALLAEHTSKGRATSIAYLAVNGANHDIYASGRSIDAKGNAQEQNLPKYARAFIFDGADGHLKCEIDGSETPQGSFGFGGGGSERASLAVDQVSGDFYVSDIGNRALIDQFDDECHYIGQIEHTAGVEQGFRYNGGLAVDGPFPGQPGYDSPNQGELYVATGESPPEYHLYAFAPLLPPKPAEVRAQAVASVTATEAVLEAEVNPNGIETTYRFQYISQADYEADGETYGQGASSLPSADADAGSGSFFKSVSVPVSGLLPRTAYRFRLVASSHCVEAEPEALCTTAGEGKAGAEGTDAAFATYGPPAGLPDARAYELVSPPDTGGLIPTNPSLTAGNGFPTPLVSPDGDSVAFGTEGGSLAGLEANGYHDRYLAQRGPEGWQTSSASLSGAQSSEPRPGGIAPDHRYSFWDVGNGTVAGGALAPGNYLRGPAGVEPIGIGSLGIDPYVSGRWIGEDGDHIVFFNTFGGFDHNVPVQLEPNAPPSSENSPVAAIYERSADGPTEVVSLLPGEITPTASATYKGTSADGSATVFGLRGDPNLYVRLGGSETQLVATGSPEFGGISTHGTRVVYLRPNLTEPRRPNPVSQVSPGPPQGQIFTYDTQAKEATQIGSGEQAVLVNVSPDGSHIYFLSPELLGGESEIAAKTGAENLYVWDAASQAIHFIATLTTRDVYGEINLYLNETPTDGLGLWTDYALNSVGAPTGPGSDPSRASADGRVLLFESRARLSAYENAGHSEIYRFDATSQALRCLSCTPTGVPAAGDARLQSPPAAPLFSLPPVNDFDAVINLTPDGARAFFQSAEPLVMSDTDALTDVYEWEAPGKGSCTQESPAYQAQSEGCLYLISGGHSASDDYLYGISTDGSDVVFLSGDLLSFEDRDNTPSLYDARIGGGFPPPSPPPGECLGEACQPAAQAPDDPAPASTSFQGAGNVSASPSRRCAKGQRKVRRQGKVRCLKAHHKDRKSQRHNANRRAAR